jgi:phosphoribosylformylglycinamidine synthase
MGKELKAIVLRTAGINCDYESKHVLERLGVKTDLVHINSLIRDEINLLDYRLLFIPGGFSHGDYLGSGKVFANKLTHKLNGVVPEFVEKGNLVIGICNGFQVLVKAGILPGFDSNYKKQEMSLTFNDSSLFQCEWVKLKNKNKGRCIFTKGIEEMSVPIAHAEGKFVADQAVLNLLYENDQVVFKYENNPNGSVDDIAGICDETGRVLGMMPHPERNQYSWQDPRSHTLKMQANGDGFKIFENAVNYLKEKSQFG